MGDKYKVVSLLTLNKKTIGAEILDIQTGAIFRIKKPNFIIYKGRLDNAIVTVDSIIRGKNYPLPKKEVSTEELYIHNNNVVESKSIKNYTIMHGNVRVISINFKTGEYIVYNSDNLPFGLRNNKLRALEIASWISDRIDNINRTYMNIVYIARKVGRDKTKVLRDSCGMSFTDNFWIKTNDINITWEELRKLRDINIALSNIALTGKIDTDKDLLSGYTSLFTTKGYFPKAIIGGYIYKRKDDAYLEYPAYLIGKQLGISIAECSIEGQYVKIRIFTDSNTSLVHASELKKYFNTDGEIYNEFIKDESKTNIIEQMHRLFIFNYIIGNPDLHDDNYGVLYDSNTFEFKSLAPCYDHNVAFQEGFTGLVRSKVNSFPASPIDEWTKQFIGYHPDIVLKLRKIDLSQVKRYLTDRQYNELISRIANVIAWGTGD